MLKAWEGLGGECKRLLLCLDANILTPISKRTEYRSLLRTEYRSLLRYGLDGAAGELITRGLCPAETPV